MRLSHFALLNIIAPVVHFYSTHTCARTFIDVHTTYVRRVSRCNGSVTYVHCLPSLSFPFLSFHLFIVYLQNINPVGPYEQLLRTVGMSSFLRKRLSPSTAISRADLLNESKKMLQSKYHLPGRDPAQPAPFGTVSVSAPGSVMVQQINTSIAENSNAGRAAAAHSTTRTGAIGVNPGNPLGTVPSFGDKVVGDILGSEWIVEELMLETRVARLSVETGPIVQNK